MGQDMLVKGGTVSDVLANVPSVSVDVEGNVQEVAQTFVFLLMVVLQCFEHGRPKAESKATP
jgi:hypothetical protein